MSAVVEAGPGYRIRKAAPADAGRLAPLLRRCDADELRAVGWADPVVALTASLAASDEAYVAEAVDTKAEEAGAGDLACLFGVGPFPEASDVGAPWLVASDAVWRIRRPLARRSRAWTESLGARYGLLLNVADARNAAHLRWLRWCGFSVIRALPRFGPERRLFYEFARLTQSRGTAAQERCARHRTDHGLEEACAIPLWAS